MNNDDPEIDGKDELLISRSSASPNRRAMLKLGVASGAALAAGFNTPAVAGGGGQSRDTQRLRRRVGETARTRFQSLQRNLRASLRAGSQRVNGDDQRYETDRFYAAFTKTLPHNRYGEVDPHAYRALQRAVKRGTSRAFDSVPLAPGAARGLANPQGAYRVELIGLDGQFTRINPAHSFRSAALAGEMAEVYWQALLRDEPYINYASSTGVGKAVADLNRMSVTPGAGANGPTNAVNLFRGETPGDLAGPYISQFLCQPFSFGPVDVDQRYETGAAGIDYMRNSGDWLNVLNGGRPLETAIFDPVKKYIFNNRSLGEYVHRDVLYQAYLHAALILLGYGAPAVDEGNPYGREINNQGAFTSLGGPFVIDMLSKAANLSLAGAWYQKWLQRVLRPEVLAGRVHYHLSGARRYELHPDILHSDAVAELMGAGGNAFLPMGYIEGSPTHPSYPAGHATVAGACVTVLKAFFNESYVIPEPVEADATGDSLLRYSGTDLTVGGELNKLANNIALGRDAAGVHYRQDGVQGLAAGEQQAIVLLQDYSTTLSESNFGGFKLTTFDGERVRIRGGQVLPG